MKPMKKFYRVMTCNNEDIPFQSRRAALSFMQQWAKDNHEELDLSTPEDVFDGGETLIWIEEEEFYDG